MSELLTAAAAMRRREIDGIASRLEPLQDYAARPLPEAFSNLDDVLAPELSRHAVTPGTEFDVTAFYSRIKTDLAPEDTEALTQHNDGAYERAIAAGGLVLYYQGKPTGSLTAAGETGFDLDFTPNCMSFCIWESRRQARAALQMPEHQAAARGVRRWYEAFGIKKYALTLQRPEAAGVGADLVFREYRP